MNGGGGGNLNVLVEAKKEYMDQLCMLMCPLMIETFYSMYVEAVKLSKNKKVLRSYHDLLKDVVNLNNHIIKQHAAKLTNACAWFNDLLAAVFVSYVKILSAVRINSENKKISLKLPSNESFIHGCYEAAAKELYKDPYIFQTNSSEYDRELNLMPRFRACVEETVKNMIPIQQILHTYISQGKKMENENIDFDEQKEGGDEDPDISDIEEEEEELAPVDSFPKKEEEEVKEIKIDSGGSLPAPAPVKEEEEEEEDLFPEAPIKKST